jgi:dTDP-4-amino-4,6-dideoxygalactose transaminase
MIRLFQSSIFNQPGESIRMEIPAHNLKQQYESIKEEIDSSLRDVIDNTDFILGDAVESFETNFAEFCETDYAIGVSSGTAALRLVYEALGISDGDQVITTPFTFVATAEPLLHMGAEPVFVDIDPENYNLDPNRVEDAITDRTKAIVFVDLYGQPSGVDQLREIARSHDIPLVEDAAQAHGARWKNEPAGSLGDVATFSFYPGKNLGAFGDAGGITTSDESLANSIKSLRDHGRTEKYDHARPGFNFRMDGLQGAVLDVKLNYISDWNEKRRKNAQFYENQLKDIPVVTPSVATNAKHVFHQYAIRTQNRDAVKEHLNDHDIGAGIHYPKPLHLQPAMDELSYSRNDFPEAEKAAKEVLSLPVHSMLDKSQLEVVVDTLENAIEGTGTLNKPKTVAGN